MNKADVHRALIHALARQAIDADDYADGQYVEGMYDALLTIYGPEMAARFMAALEALTTTGELPEGGGAEE